MQYTTFKQSLQIFHHKMQVKDNRLLMG